MSAYQSRIGVSSRASPAPWFSTRSILLVVATKDFPQPSLLRGVGVAVGLGGLDG